MLRNLVVLAVLIAVSSGYLMISRTLMPGTHALIVVVSLVVAPFVTGILGGYLMVGRLTVKLPLLLVVPFSHIFVYGSDPAKPGLENLVALLEVLPLLIGCLVAHLVVSRKNAKAAGSSGQS